MSFDSINGTKQVVNTHLEGDEAIGSKIIIKPSFALLTSSPDDGLVAKWREVSQTSKKPEEGKEKLSSYIKI